MRKTVLGFALLSTSLLLASCGASKVSSSGTKKKLEKAGYDPVSVVSKSDYEQSLIAKLLAPTEGFDSYLVANKKEDGKLKEYMSAWFFDSIDHATAFNDKYIATLVSALEIESVDLKVGSYNNVVYAATENAVSTASFKI